MRIIYSIKMTDSHKTTHFVAFSLPSSHHPLISSAIALKNNSITTTVAVKINSLSGTDGCKWVWCSLKSPITRTLLLFDLTAPWKSPILRACLYWTWMKTLCENSSIPGYLPKTISDNISTSQMPEMVMLVQANISLTKKILKKKAWVWGVQRGLFKAQIYSWESIRSYAHEGLWQYPGNTWKALTSLLWLTLRSCAHRKWSKRQSCKQHTEVVPQTHTQSPSKV